MNRYYSTSLAISLLSMYGSLAFIPHSTPNVSLQKVKTVKILGGGSKNYHTTTPTTKQKLPFFTNGRPTTHVSYQDPSSLSMEELREIASRSGFDAKSMSRTGLEKIANSFIPQPATNDPSEMTLEELNRVAKKGGYDLTGMERDALEKIAHEVLGTKPTKKPKKVVEAAASAVEESIPSTVLETSTNTQKEQDTIHTSKNISEVSHDSQQTRRRNFSAVSSYLDQIGAAAASAVTTYMTHGISGNDTSSSSVTNTNSSSSSSTTTSTTMNTSSPSEGVTTTTNSSAKPMAFTENAAVKPTTLEERMAMEEKKSQEATMNPSASASISSAVSTPSMESSQEQLSNTSSNSSPPPPGPFDFQPLPGSCLGPNGMGSSERVFYSPSSAPPPPVSIKVNPAPVVSPAAAPVPSPATPIVAETTNVSDKSQGNSMKSSTSSGGGGGSKFGGTVELLSEEELENLKPLPGSCLGTAPGKGPRMGTSSRFETPSTSPLPAYEHLSNPKSSSPTPSSNVENVNNKPRTIEERMAMEEKKAEEMRSTTISTSVNTIQETTSQVQTTKPSTLEERMAMEQWPEPDAVAASSSSVNTSTAPIVPPPMTQQPKYVVGQVVTYKTGEEVQITAVHNDPTELIYEILLKDGREKQTTEEHISGEPQGLLCNNIESSSSKNKRPSETTSKNSILHMTAPTTHGKTEKESYMEQVVKKATNLPVSEDSRESIEQMARYIQELGKQVNDLKSKIKVDELERQKNGSENEDLKHKFHVALEQNDALLKQNQALQAQNEEFVSRNDRLLQQLEELKSMNHEFKKQNDKIMQQNEKMMKDILRQNKSLSDGIH